MAATDVEICNLALDYLGVTQKITSLADATRESQACGRWYSHAVDMALLALPWRFARRVGHFTQYGAAQATVTFQDSVAAGGTVVVNGVTFTAVASNPGANQFLRATPKAVTAGHFADAVNASTSTGVSGVIKAVLNGSVVTLFAITPGDEGNDYTLTETSAQITVSGATFTGGKDDVTHEYNYAYVLPADFLVAHRIISGNRNDTPLTRYPFDLGLCDDGDAKVFLADFVEDDGSIAVEYTSQVTTVTMFPPHFVDALAYLLASKLVMPLALKSDLAVTMSKAARLAFDAAYALEMSGRGPDAPPDSEIITARL